MKGSATISWRVERKWPGRLTVSASHIIPYPEAGGASRVELLEYVSHSVPLKTCNEMMLAEAICCPPLPRCQSVSRVLKRHYSQWRASRLRRSV
jgi:hypothetical protein